MGMGMDTMLSVRDFKKKWFFAIAHSYIAKFFLKGSVAMNETEIQKDICIHQLFLAYICVGYP